VDLELIHLWRKNGRMPTGDFFGVVMGINVSLDQQLSRPFVDRTKIARLFLFFGKGTIKNAPTD